MHVCKYIYVSLRYLNILRYNCEIFRKSWTQVYVVLQGSNLVFYKDQKSAQQKQGSPHGKPDSVVSLQGARVDLNPKELSSKKNTISVRFTEIKSNQSHKYSGLDNSNTLFLKSNHGHRVSMLS